MANIARMTKKQLVAHGKKLGMNLSMSSTRKTMIAEIKSFKKPTNQTVKKKATIAKTNATVATVASAQVAQPEKKSILQSIKEFFGL